MAHGRLARHASAPTGAESWRATATLLQDESGCGTHAAKTWYLAIELSHMHVPAPAFRYCIATVQVIVGHLTLELPHMPAPVLRCCCCHGIAACCSCEGHCWAASRKARLEAACLFAPLVRASAHTVIVLPAAPLACRCSWQPIE